MNLLRTLFRWIAPLVVLGGAVAIFMAMGSQPPPLRKTADGPIALSVKTVAARALAGGLDIEADGVVVPLREVTLAAEVGGRVVEKSELCKAGHFVKKGSVLFRIDPRDYELDVARLERELSQAGLLIEEIDEEISQNAATIDLARQQLDLARKEAARLGGLKADRFISEGEHERSLRDELTATNTLTTLTGQNRVLAKRRNRLQEAQGLAGTMLERSRLDLARTQVVAPVDGVVVEDTVEQDSFVAKGTPLVTVEDTSAAEIRTSLRMDEVARIWGGLREGGNSPLAAHDIPDTPAKVVFRLGDKVFEWDGLLSRQEGRGLDEKTRTLPCRVIVKAPDQLRALDRYGAPMATLPPGSPGSLLRGMFVEVRVQVEAPMPLVSVPQEVVRPSGDLFVVRDGKLVILRPRPFHTGNGIVAFEQGIDGLQAGDRVVASQLSNPREGMLLSEETP